MFRVLTQGDLLASALGSQSGRGSHGERKNDMTTGQEKSDRHVVPEGRRKAAPTAATRGGKVATVSQQADQLELFSETADSPQGDVAGADTGLPVPATSAVPKSEATTGTSLPAMTMESIASLDNLILAFEQVASNKGAPGPDRQTIEAVRSQLDTLLPAVQRALLEGTYQPGMIRRVWIPKPGGGGHRGLGIPNVVDRLVGQSVQRVLGPHYEPTFHPSSHGFRPGHSCHTAIQEAESHLANGYEWVVDLDLEKFFDRVNHDRLLSRLTQRIDDRRVVTLIRRMLKAKVVMPDGVVVSTEEGAPQGGPLSPLLSNIVLDELDWELARRGHRFVRYADDANIYVHSERAGHRVMASVTRFIEERLRLKVNTAKSAVARPEDRHFVGFSLRREPMDGSIEVLLSARSRTRVAAKARELTPCNWGQSLRDCIQKVNEYLTGWLGFFWVCTDERSFHNLDAHIRRRLRAIMLRHWRRKRTVARRLAQRKVKKSDISVIYKRRRSWWWLSACYPVHRGLRSKVFARMGLFSLERAWRKRQRDHGRDPARSSIAPWWDG